MPDLMVLGVQQWLNATYGSHPQWIPVAETATTGWPTIYGLTRALQIEMGITNLADAFGPTTRAQFGAQYGAVGPTSPYNAVRIVQGALWCKGYIGGWVPGSYDGTVSTSVISLTQDIGLPGSAMVNVKVMQSLLTMDQFTLVSSGAAERQEAQRWLNSKYVGRANFAILPCDGLYNRGTQQGVMYAIQFELEMTDSVANGNFGPGTKSGLQSHATVSSGSQDTTKNWVRLFQGLLRFNGFNCSFSGNFDASTVTAAKAFQALAALPQSGIGNYQTWAALLVSTGDESRAGIASDMATQLTAQHCSLLYNSGYRTVGRYLTVNSKRYLPGELDRIFAAGLKTFPIMQEANTSSSDFSLEKGRDHGMQALRRLRQLGFKSGATVFFAVDYDATDDGITARIIPFFQGVNQVLNSSRENYSVGIYGTRNVCSRVIAAGLATEGFIAGMSWGWSGNLGFPLPADWSYDQIQTLTITGNGTSIEIDKNIQSIRAHPVGSAGVVKTPLTSAGGFDEDYFWYLTECCVRAEIAENASIYAQAMANDFVLHRLQREYYWHQRIQPGSNPQADALWNAYTPLLDYTPGVSQTVSDGRSLARGTYEETAVSPPTSTRTRLSHWAASTRAYLNWGVPNGSNVAEFGDLGGWALDLATLWEYFRDEVKPTFTGNVRTFFAEYVGGPSIGSFGAEDLLCDVDAYLCAKRLKENNYRPVSDVVREIETGEVPRFATFVNERFGGSRANIVAAATHLFATPNLIIAAPVMLKTGLPLPNGAELQAVADGFADALLARV